MKKMHCILMGTLLPLLCAAQSGKFNLTIHTSSVKPGTKAYLLYQYDGNKVMDSSVNKANQFHFSNLVNRPLRASIVLDSQQIGLPALLKSRSIGMDILVLYVYPGRINARTQNSIASAQFATPGINADFQAYQRALHDNTTLHKFVRFFVIGIEFF